jgi:hypothetical protein
MPTLSVAPLHERSICVLETVVAESAGAVGAWVSPLPPPVAARNAATCITQRLLLLSEPVAL